MLKSRGSTHTCTTDACVHVRVTLFTDVCGDLPSSSLANKSRKLLKFVSIVMKLKACETEDGVMLPDSETLSHLLQMLDCVQKFQELQDSKDELTGIISEMKCQV